MDRPAIAVLHPYWTLWEHTAGPTFRDERLALARRVAAASGDRRSADAGGPTGGTTRSAPRVGALLVLALLAIVSVAVAPLPRAPQPPAIELPLEHAGWSGEELELDRVFVGQFHPGQVLHRRYQRELRARPAQIVDLLVGYEATENPSSRLLSPKLRVPDHDWSLTDLRPARLWLLGIDAQAAGASRAGEVVLSYFWRLRDEGLWRETWRAAAALDAGPLRRERRRVVVRLTTPLANAGPDARDRGKRALDRFIADFRDALAGL